MQHWTEMGLFTDYRENIKETLTSSEKLQNDFRLNLPHPYDFGHVEIFNLFSYEYCLVNVLDNTKNKKNVKFVKFTPPPLTK